MAIIANFLPVGARTYFSGAIGEWVNSASNNFAIASVLEAVIVQPAAGNVGRERWDGTSELVLP